MKSDIFTLLKRNNSFKTGSDAPADFLIRLDLESDGAFLTTVDRKGKEFTLPEYERFSGVKREILKSFQQIKSRELYKIDWSAKEERICLEENEHLLYLLKNSRLLVNDKLQPVEFAAEPVNLQLSIEAENNFLCSKLNALLEDGPTEDFVFLNENHLLSANRICQTAPAGDNFRLLKHFNTRFEADRLEPFLSLFYSLCPAVELIYNDYRTVPGEPLQAKSAVVFEKVDEYGSLHLKAINYHPDFAAGFLENYEITRVARLNELEKTVVIQEMIYENIQNCLNEVESLVKKGSSGQEDSFYREGNFFYLGEHTAGAFLKNGLGSLLALYPVLGAEKLSRYKIKTVQPRLKLTLKSGIDYLSGTGEMEIEGESYALNSVLADLKKNPYIVLSDGTTAIISNSYLKRLERVLTKQKDGIKISFFDLPLVEELIDEKTADDSWPEVKNIFRGFNQLGDKKYALPAMNATLRDYQHYGFKWLSYLKECRLGGCLADDMGLGKTLQALTLLVDTHRDRKESSLIVMPKSLLFNWESEIKKFCPQLTYYIYYSQSRDLQEALKSNLILTTYAMVRNDIELFKEQNFHYIILDESQNIKNISTQISKAVMLLKGSHRLALSGTPLENNLGELYALFRFLNPAMFGSFEDFNRRYLLPVQKDNDRETMHELKKKIYPFILRRLKKEVAAELPDKVEQILYVDLSDEQAALYEERRRFYQSMVKEEVSKAGLNKAQFFILQAITELRQLATVPENKTDGAVTCSKREVLIEQLREMADNNHKALVFANYIGALEAIAEDLEKEGIEYLMMTGATADRKKLVNRFQNESRYKVFLMTLKTGGVGLNLTAADFVFIYDPWWNRSAQNQPIDRTHRIGQQKTVFCYKIIARNTIEEKILELQKQKSALFDELISSDTAGLKHLDEKDLDYIFN